MQSEFVTRKTPKPIVNPLIAKIRDAAGTVFDKMTTTTESAAPRTSEKVTTCAFDISSDQGSDNEDAEPAIVKVTTNKDDGTSAVDALLFRKTPKKSQRPKISSLRAPYHVRSTNLEEIARSHHHLRTTKKLHGPKRS